MVFIAPGKLFTFLRYLSFCPDFCGHVGKWLGKQGKKLRLISKFMARSTEKQIITIHVLPNIPRSKGNQTMKFR